MYLIQYLKCINPKLYSLPVASITAALPEYLKINLNPIMTKIQLNNNKGPTNNKILKSPWSICSFNNVKINT